MADESCIKNPNLVVVTGGPGSGKTTVLSELRRRGFPFAPEVAIQIIQEQVKQGGTALPWEDRELYASVMLQRSIESFMVHTPASTTTFADRGIPDTLAYAHLIGLRNDRAIREACERYRYASRVFFAPAWREIYTTDTERKQDFEEAKGTAWLLVKAYREYGYEVVELPRVNLEERAELVLREIHSQNSGERK